MSQIISACNWFPANAICRNQGAACKCNPMITVSRNRKCTAPFASIWKFISMLYYRYTLEMGICILEWWEVVLVNTYFLLLTSSFIKQMIKVTKYASKMLLRLLSVFKSKMRVHSSNTTISST